ncbi:DUF3043 domain-containing protein [Corynebacterium choanae]|uniref:DUF3043 domain-containing protein n=1 Tax=Corynebacterium choanae TaxID=1862358 RepID=UPI000F4EAA3D|nr:DUF3043 domain-containing protein [Corynebacterium choanae]
MKLPWNKDETSTPAATETPVVQPQEQLPKGYTPKKGRPTPKRNEVELAKGVRHAPVRPAETPAEARARRKELKASMSREEWKALKRREKDELKKAQQRTRAAMDRGDERFLLERDKGPAKAYIRDWVDARRFFSTLMLPIAVLLLVFMIAGQKFPEVAAYSSMFGLLAMIIFVVEGIWLGRKSASEALEHYPDTPETKMSLGFYAYSRASQPRRLRSPKPRLEVGGAPVAH